jgi:hypothetical protein
VKNRAKADASAEVAIPQGAELRFNPVVLVPASFNASLPKAHSTLDRHLRKQRAQDQGSRAGNRLLAFGNGMYSARICRCSVLMNRKRNADTYWLTVAGVSFLL